MARFTTTNVQSTPDPTRTSADAPALTREDLRDWHNREYHYGLCTERTGPMGGLKVTREVWRSNGALSTWKTRLDEFKLPIKHGMRDFSYLTHENIHMFHLASKCTIK